MTGFTDIEFTGIFICQIKGKLYGMADVRNVLPAQNDIVTMTTPSFGISWEINGENFCVGCFYSIINSS